jgi:acetyl esterase/lipase
MVGRHFQRLLSFVTGEGEQPARLPRFMRSHWRGCLPTLIITAEYDSLAPEAELYAQRLEEAGMAVSHKSYEGAVHGFTHSVPLKVAEDAWEFMITHLQQAFGE